MFRRYAISIDFAGATSGDLASIEKEFGCSISEPSNWVEYGSTRERGLTFLNKDGKELSSSVFMHQPIFNAPQDKAENERDEIKNFIRQTLLQQFQITPADVRIKVTEYNRL